MCESQSLYANWHITYIYIKKLGKMHGNFIEIVNRNL